MSKQLFLVIGGAAAAAVVAAAVVFIVLPMRDSGQAGPPLEVGAPASAEHSSRAVLGDRAPQAAPPASQAIRQEYADWVLVCPENNSSAARCLIGQNHIEAETQRSIFAIQLRRADDGGLEARLTTPLYVLLQPGVALDLGQGEAIKIEFRQCVQERCEADAKLNEAALAKLLMAEAAHASFTTANGRTAGIRISMNGFAQAFAALEDQAPN